MFGRMIVTRRVRAFVPLSLLTGMLVLSSLSATALADEPQNITVVLTEYKFAPDTITLTVGQPVQLNVQNQGKADHNLSSDDLPLANITYQKADNSESDLRSYVANNVLNADALSGHTSVVTFTPTRAGSFGFFSEDEESLGMVGKFQVVAPGSPATAAPPAAASAGTSSPTVARDGQSLASQSAATQAMFTAVWGNRAAEEWVQEHNATLPR